MNIRLMNTRWVGPKALALVSLGLLLPVGICQVGAGVAQAAPEKSPANSEKLRTLRLPDQDGKSRALVDYADARALVVVFLGTECPIANSYAPKLTALSRQYAERGVQFVGVNANPAEDREAVAAHAKAYSLPFPVLKDPRQALADALEARVTPEVFVLDPGFAVRYRGRIDDQYASRTRKRSEAKAHDLREALEAVLAGKAVAKAETRAFGCAIARSQKTAKAGTGKVTYHRDVAPILQERCQACHRPGQIAPFSLMTYADARSWASEIKEFTANRQMPPWLAEPGHGEFQDVRRMSDREIATLAEWADAGAPEGKKKDAPPPKSWSDEWMLGKPDLVLEPSAEYQVGASGDDEFHVFVLPTNLVEDKQVVAVDFRPGNSRVVHHVVSFVDTSGKGRELDAAHPGPGYASGPGGVKVPNARIQGVWAPGNLPRFLPTGVGRPLPKGSDVLIQVHYHKTGKVEMDRTQVALYFAKEPVTRTAHTAIWGPFNIDIPPNAPRHEQRLSITLPAPIQVLNIMPHMHLLGKEMKVTATLPDGTHKNLVWITNWDYRWQDSYRYKEPLRLPKGTKVEVVAYWDNTSDNPLNPSNPPRRVRFGEQTTDEMAFAIMEIIPDLVPAVKAAQAQ